MRTTSTKQLKLAYNLSIDIAKLLRSRLANPTFNSSVSRVEQVSRLGKIPPSRLLWQLGGSLIIGVVIWSMLALPWQDFTMAIAGLAIGVLMVLLGAANFRREQRQHSSEREEVQVESTSPLHKQNRALSNPINSQNGNQFLGQNPTNLIFRDTLENIYQNGAVVVDLDEADDRRNFEDSVAVSAEPLQPGRWERRFILASGEVKWLQSASQPDLQTNGNILSDGVLMDLTERKQSQASLDPSEKQFKVIFEQVSVAIAQVGANGQLLEVNKKLCQITGYSREELLKRTIADITYPEDRDVDQMYLRQFFSWQEGTLKVEKRCIHKMGSLVWVNMTVSLVREPNRQPKYFICAIEDITHCKQIQAAVQRREQRFQSLIENASDIIIMLNTEGTLSYASPSIKRILGHDPKDLVGLNLFELIHPEDTQRVIYSFTQVIQFHSSGIPVEFRFQHQDGSWHTLEVIGQSSFDEAQETKIIINSRDITERKQTEAVLLERSRLSTLAAQVGIALANGGTLLTILQLCTEALVQQLNVTSAAVWTLNPASQQLEQQAASGQLLPLKPEFINQVIQNRQPHASGEWEDERQPSPLSHCFSAYPLVVEDRPIGVLVVSGNHPLTEEARTTLSWVTNAIAVAIDRYWARSELLSRRESLLFKLANQIRNSLELDTILETAVESIRSLFQIDRCQFLWYKTDEIVPYWEVVKEARNPILNSHIRQYTLAHVSSFAERLLDRQIIRVDRVETLTEPSLGEFLSDRGYTSILSIPVETRSGEIGAITCAHCTEARPWEHSEVELLQTVVEQLAIALDQAELYAQARQAAGIAQAQTQQLEQALSELQIGQSQLVQTEKMSSMGKLVAGVAHEINNPVNFINGNLAYASAYFYDILNLLRFYQDYCTEPSAEILAQAELINIDFIAKDLPKLLTSMQRGTDRIRSIVSSLQNFSGLDEIDMRKIDLHESIENTLLKLQHRLKPTDQKPEIQICKEYGKLPAVECYPVQLNQAVTNILCNAIEALQESGVGSQEHSPPAITIRTSISNSSDSQNTPIEQSDRGKTQNAESVVIRIADNGPGMTDTVKRRLFDPFFTTKPVGQGTGLGLSVSYQIIVEHHHGILTCTSAPGKGTEFCIAIPIQQMN